MSKVQPFPVIPEYGSQEYSWGFHFLPEKNVSAHQNSSLSTPVTRNFGRRKSLKRPNMSAEALSGGLTIKRRNSGRIMATDGACDSPPPTHRCNSRRQSCLEYPHTKPVEATRVRFTSNETQQRSYQYEQNETLSSQFLNPFTNQSASYSRRESESSSISAYLRPNAFTGHRDTLARLHSNENVLLSMPPRVLNHIVSFLSFKDYKNARLTCRCWHDFLPKPILPALFRLPAEVVQQIYWYLQPSDFDAARHTCRSWYLASLDRAIGYKMLERAGCISAFLVDLAQRRKGLQKSGQHHIDSEQRIQESFYEEWMISRRLATESRISPTWRGIGLSDCDGHSTSRLAVTEAIRFNELWFGDEVQNRSVKKFTISACGKFVLVVASTEIFVYSLKSQPSTMQLCARLVTGKDVLSVSMDTSGGRYGIAALLARNLGVSWEVDDIFGSAKASQFHGEPMSLGMQTDVNGSENLSLSRAALEENRSLIINGNELQAAVTPTGFPRQNILGLDSFLCTSPSAQSSPGLSEVEIPDYFNGATVIPIRTKPSHIFKRIGYTDDEPLSVAICPYRQCVAFGCKTGIELHWNDAVTGRDLNRWFPVVAPSQHLYFLPQRFGIDSDTRIRLISSMEDPKLQAVNQSSDTSKSRRPSRFRRITEHLHGQRLSAERLDNTRINCDHYRAVPLSDGTHVLFTDPLTGLLCLGSDAHLGGPTKLIRKAVMIPPRSDKTEIGVLTGYAVSHDLGFGVRIVAAYLDGSVVLYNIPRDHFEKICGFGLSMDVWGELPGAVPGSGLPTVDLDLARHDTLVTDPSLPPLALKVHGAYVGRLDSGIEEMHLDCDDGGLKLWVFQKSGQITKWDIYAARDHQIQSYIVGLDGTINVAQEAETDGKHAAEDVGDEDTSKSGISFTGLDGMGDFDFHYSDTDFEDLAFLEQLSTEARALHPGTAQDREMPTIGLRNNVKFELEVLTDWRDSMLLSPYLVYLE